MNRAGRRREFRNEWKNLFYNEFNKENYPRKSRQERKTLAKEKVRGELDD
jgi:hypothetical protein